MKFKTKVISLFIALVLTFALSVQVFAASNSFADIEQISAKDKINSLLVKGIVKGTADGKFSPDSYITAAQGIQLIVNAFNLNIDDVRFFKEPKATDYFTKANDNAWYANAFIIASVKGIELPKDLEPDKQWTKEEFTYYLVSAMEKYGELPMIKIVPKEIADDPYITIEYSGAIQRSLIYGVTSLDKDKKFSPKGSITRAEAAEQVYNALEYLKAHPKP